MSRGNENRISGNVTGHVVQAGMIFGGMHLDAPVTSPSLVVETMRAGMSHSSEQFFGRSEEVGQLFAALALEEASPVVLVEGMGGVGKTALARYVTAKLVDRGLFAFACVMDFRGYESDEDAWVRSEHAVAPLLTVLADARRFVPPFEQLTAYHEALNTLASNGQRVLLLLDNVCSGEQVRDLLPRNPAHRTIVTTRDTVSISKDARRIALDALASNDAVQLFDGIVANHRPADDVDATKRLVSMCGGLPLAIEIAAALLVEDHALTADELASELQTSPTPLESLRYGERTVTAVLDVSWNRLRDRHPDAAQLFRLLPSNPGPDLSTAASAALAGVEAAQVLPWLRALRHAHLLQRSGGRWRMHDLVRHYGRTLVASREDATNRLLGYYLRTVRAAHEHLMKLSRHVSRDVFVDQKEAIAWLDMEHANLTASVALAVRTGEYLTAFELADHLGPYLFKCNYSAELVVNFRHAATAARHLSPIKQVSALDRLGFALRRIGQFEEALMLHERNISVLIDTGYRREAGKAMISLGLAQQRAGLLSKAVITCRKSFEILQGSGDGHDKIESLLQLAGVLREMGNLDEAESVYRRSLSLAQSLGDSSEPTILKELALVLYQAGRNEEAVSACQQALATLEDDLGKALVLTQLGLALRSLGRDAEAIDTLYRAVGTLREVRAPNARATALYNLGVSLVGRGQMQPALGSLREAASLFHETGDRRAEHLVLTFLESTLTAIGRFGEATAARKQAADAKP